ncbi:LysR family transcriptional regulator, partial [Salmonella enterica]
DHTTIARRISALEAALQAKLFDRRPTGYTLTIQGDRLLRSAEAIESLALAARGEIGGDALAVSGAVRIGAPDGFGSCFLAPR